MVIGMHMGMHMGMLMPIGMLIGIGMLTGMRIGIGMHMGMLIGMVSPTIKGSPLATDYYACPYRIDDDAVAVNFEREESIPQLLPPDAFKLGCS